MIKKYCFSGRDVRAAEGARLEIVCMPTKVYRGFDSRSLRQKNPFMSPSCMADQKKASFIFKTRTIC